MCVVFVEGLLFAAYIVFDASETERSERDSVSESERDSVSES